MGACALVFLVAPAASHVLPAPKGGLEARLRHHERSLRHDRQVIEFFKSHRSLLSDPRFSAKAKRQLSAHRAHLALTMRRLTAMRAALGKHRRERQLAVSGLGNPRTVICRIFGPYCRQALTVARCESNLKTWARNGEYLGLFQMSWLARRLFGHGASAEQQSRAALRYFVRSGRDWSPWTCKPW
jgi:hypothetical protein